MQSRLLLRRSLLTSVIRRWAQLDSASTVKSTKFSETPAFKKYKSGMTSIGTGGSKSYSGWSAYSDINRYSVAFSVFVFLIYFGILRYD